MSRLQDFLNELTDLNWPVSFITGTKITPASKEKIRSELDRRGIESESIDSYLAAAAGDQTEQDGCPRCYSQKFYTSSETETMNFSYASIDYKMDYKTCLVCLYSEEKEIQSQKLPVWNAFGFIKFLINRKK